MEEVNKEVLRKNHCRIVDTLDLSGSKVLDVLQEDDVISSGEQDEILSKVTKRDQNAMLLSILKRKSPSQKAFETFIKALQPEYDFIAKDLRASENKYQDCKYQTDIKTMCYHCLLKKNLNPNNLSHILYEKGLISDDDVEELNRRDISRQDRVCKLLRVLQEKPEQGLVSKQFRLSLEAKYEYLLTAGDNDGLEPYLTCRCHDSTEEKDRRKGIVERQTLSSSKRRTTRDTTEIKPRQQTSDRTQETFMTFRPNIADAFGAVDDTIYIRKRRSTLKTKLNTSINKKSNIFQADKYHDEARNVKRNKVIELREKSDLDEPGSSKILSKSFCPKSQSQNMIVREMPVVLPNNTNLMRNSAKLWNNLYNLLATGDWDKFNNLFRNGLEKLSDNADLKIQLYRSQMSACTFYRNDATKAQEMFEKAMELVPKTSMPTWHLGRILPLKVELYVQQMKFGKASSLLEQAHQTMTILSPCMSTGNVYFFQGIYLSTLLRCTRGDTQSSASIVEKVKKCFRTAIDHYQQDKVFSIKPVIGQVYLFLALFSLGVDYKKIRYSQTHNACADDIIMAQHYLYLFETCCWEDSSNWSQMLFFIARGEQFQQMKNFKRSMDYFKCARKCSVLGNFDEHRGFIDNALQLIQEKLNERVLLQCPQVHSSDAILQSLMEIEGDSK